MCHLFVHQFSAYQVLGSGVGESDVFEVAVSLVCLHRLKMWSDDRLLEDEEDERKTHEEQPEVISPCCLAATQVRLASGCALEGKLGLLVLLLIVVD